MSSAPTCSASTGISWTPSGSWSSPSSTSSAAERRERRRMSDPAENRIVLPAPTAWPMVLACGVTLLGAGYLMPPMLGIVGAAAVLLGCVGWFRDVLPVEGEEVVPFVAEP